MPYNADFKLPINSGVATVPNLEQWVNAEIQGAYNAALVDVQTAVRATGVISVDSTGSANAIVSTLPAGVAGLGVQIGGNSIIEVIAPFTNTGQVTIDVDGIGAFPVLHELGGVMEAGDLTAGASYIMRRRGSTWRLVQNGLRQDIGELRSGRQWASGGTTMTSMRPPKDAVTVTLMAGGAIQTWVKTSAPADGLETELLMRDANGQWWSRKLDSRDVNQGRLYIQWTSTPSGRNIPVTADGVICVGGNVYTYWTPTAAPVDEIETPTVKVDDKGRWWKKVPVEVLGGVDGPDFDIDTAFINQDENDPVRYVIGRAQDESPLLGFYVDGSWASSPFGSIYWPGDDIVIFETPAGDPVLAFRPDGTLIAKMEP